MHSVLIGTAGWSVPRQVADRFPAAGTSLERYAARFPVAEINSSFHRPHRPATWERWRDSVPDAFRFSVKLPKTITHQKKLVDCSAELEAFLDQAKLLGSKLAVLLVQLPPKLAFEGDVATEFFGNLASRTVAQIACEPRHPSWFTSDVGAILEKAGVARVAADPAICPEAAVPGGWPGLAYWRLHGSPLMYRSSYSDRIEQYAEAIMGAASTAQTSWCVFDNTASSAGAGDALALMAAIERET